jgi:glutathione peroxidase
MKRVISALILAALPFAASQAAPPAAAPNGAGAAAQACPAYLDHEFRRLHSSQKLNLCKTFAGKPMLIVNTASHCGYTPQYKSLEAVHQKYKDRLVVVGFASNDFNQEVADEAKSAEICFQNNGVTFPIMAATPVKGAQANPVFAELGKQTTAPKWNFNKYLVRADGKVVQHLDSKVAPDSPEFNAAIDALLK